MTQYFFEFFVLVLLYLVFALSSPGDEVGKDLYGHYVSWGPRYHRVWYRKSDIIAEELVHFNAWFPIRFKEIYKVRKNGEIIKIEGITGPLYTPLKCVPGDVEAVLERGRRLSVQGGAKT